MVSKRLKKYSSGEGSQFISRKQALKKLQLTLKDFRRLCILKGIYPREPRNRKRAQKGQTGVKVMYHMKDIQFLMHEPIIWSIRNLKVFHRKVGRSKAIKDFSSMKRYLQNRPTLKLDHIVKERYPTFIDAIRDLDDCLTLCFLFGTFPILDHINPEQLSLCRRLTIEFMHAVIEAKALRKVFISIKGYYYQAEIKGQTITWIVPHSFPFEPQSKNEIDFKLMSTFIEFYVILLGFINFRLFHSLNLFYPPKLALASSNNLKEFSIDENEKVAALNHPLNKKSNDSYEEECTLDAISDEISNNAAAAQQDALQLKNLLTLFKGLKFFLNRETPREHLVFVIRSFGGEVSWDKNLFLGATFDEDNETITHQIVDRSNVDKHYISRYYIQPQWVFDCVNARKLLPVEKYFIGNILPPHLSPFTNTDEQLAVNIMENEVNSDINSHIEINKDANSDINSHNVIHEDANETVKVHDALQNDSEEETIENTQKKNLSVTQGKIIKNEPWKQKVEDRQEYKLREKMIKKKHRKMYSAMMQRKREKDKETWLLKKKKKKLISEKIYN